VIPRGELQILHRHGNDWTPLHQADHSPDDHDVERRLLRGEKLYRCEECELEILVVPPDGNE
jgi:hypothetical protein